MDSGCHEVSENIWFAYCRMTVEKWSGRLGGSDGALWVMGGWSVNSGCHKLSENIWFVIQCLIIIRIGSRSVQDDGYSVGHFLDLGHCIGSRCKCIPQFLPEKKYKKLQILKKIKIQKKFKKKIKKRRKKLSLALKSHCC